MTTLGILHPSSMGGAVAAQARLSGAEVLWCGRRRGRQARSLPPRWPTSAPSCRHPGQRWSTAPLSVRPHRPREHAALSLRTVTGAVSRGTTLRRKRRSGSPPARRRRASIGSQAVVPQLPESEPRPCNCLVRTGLFLWCGGRAGRHRTGPSEGGRAFVALGSGDERSSVRPRRGRTAFRSGRRVSRGHEPVGQPQGLRPGHLPGARSAAWPLTVTRKAQQDVPTWVKIS